MKEFTRIKSRMYTILLSIMDSVRMNATLVLHHQIKSECEKGSYGDWFAQP